MEFQSTFPNMQPTLVSLTRTRNDASTHFLANLSSFNHSSAALGPYNIADVLRIEEARMVTQIALAQARIAREHQALNLRQFPFLLNPMLDIIGAASMVQKKTEPQRLSSSFPCGLARSPSISESVVDSVSACSNDNIDNSSSDENEESYTKTYVESIETNDVLCGRGGRSNHHVGNKRYRLVVARIKYMYQQCAAKTMKTDLSRAIVKHCSSYGARFLKLDESNDKYYILSKTEARKKTSQALRESKALKWVN